MVDSLLESDEAFRNTLKRILKTELKISVSEFSKKSGISQSTIYKIISENREPNLKTLRQIIKAINKIEGLKGEPFVAIIVSRSALNVMDKTRMNIEGKRIAIREYPAHSMEETLVSAVNAERDGAVAVVCAPIVSTTIEKLLRIPVVTIVPEKDTMEKCVHIAAKKTNLI